MNLSEGSTNDLSYQRQSSISRCKLEGLCISVSTVKERRDGIIFCAVCTSMGFEGFQFGGNVF